MKSSHASETAAVVHFATLEPTLWPLTVMGLQTRKPFGVVAELVVGRPVVSDTPALIVAMTIVMSSALIAALELPRVRSTYLFKRICYLHEYFYLLRTCEDWGLVKHLWRCDYVK
jgi:hypothetical protein